jgi:hypothetical protein
LDRIRSRWLGLLSLTSWTSIVLGFCYFFCYSISSIVNLYISFFPRIPLTTFANAWPKPHIATKIGSKY